MNLSVRIAPLLPLLRRYARAVTGTQNAGDAYVAATLEALIADISSFPALSDDRVSLYRMFAQLIETTKLDLRQGVSPFAWEQRATATLSSVPTTERQAFLLLAIEGFNAAQIGEILDASADDVHELLSRAAHQVSEDSATEIMIIEDEPLIAMDIESLVSDLGHSVTGVARTLKEAVALFAQKPPKMVLADIQLADGSSGIDAVNLILKTSDIPVIFITAFPERLLSGQRPEPAFLVTKPFNPNMVQAMISQALFFQQNIKTLPENGSGNATL
jgi:DNA-directed RNA polymerase specialized sigma24 family protein